MEDQKRNPQQTKEFEEMQKAHEKTLEALDLKNQGYKCFSCGNNVNWFFLMQFIKDSGLCPDCFTKDE